MLLKLYGERGGDMKEICEVITNALRDNNFEVMWIGRGNPNYIVTNYIDDKTDKLVGVTITIEKQKERR